MTDFLLFDHITVRHLDRVLFNRLTFSMSEGQHLALVGPSGSGKSAFLETIHGKFNVSNGAIRYFFYERYRAGHQITDPLFNYHKLIAFVSHQHHFRNLSHTSDFYYQQRYNSFDSDDAPTVKSFLSTVPANNMHPTAWTLETTISKLNLGHLLDQQLIKLSNGETRRLLFAAGLLKNPRLLLLDNPFAGLDAASRPYFHSLINEIIASGITVVMSTTPREIPEGITHVLRLDEGTIAEYSSRADFIKGSAADHAREAVFTDKEALSNLLSYSILPQFDKVVSMKNVTVRYGDKLVLDGLSWEIKQGERWALQGPNGAGKTTLLSLINGDNPQAYANDITLFDRKRGTGESIWDIKKNIGFVSPELLQYFKTGSTCLDVVESGFYDTIGLFRKSSPRHAELALQWLQLFRIEEYAKSRFQYVSSSVKRLCLLARALVKNPALLILDEPCQGLDEQQQQLFKELINFICATANTTLIYVSHYKEEIPEVVDKVLSLQQGRLLSETPATRE